MEVGVAVADHPGERGGRQRPVALVRERLRPLEQGDGNGRVEGSLAPGPCIADPVGRPASPRPPGRSCRDSTRDAATRP